MTENSKDFEKLFFKKYATEGDVRNCDWFEEFFEKAYGNGWINTDWSNETDSGNFVCGDDHEELLEFDGDLAAYWVRTSCGGLEGPFAGMSEAILALGYDPKNWPPPLQLPDELDDDWAEKFIADEEFELNSFRSIHDWAADRLSTYRFDLDLSGIERLSDHASESLAGHKGGYLNLAGLKTLSITQAKTLSRHANVIISSSVITDETRKLLAGKLKDGEWSILD
ncbi:hypothetical protein N9134_01370 [Akkermansiaceae bacterium]|nr:hypothetical protein [Akkermansiaceae bacterium]MDB4406834.1 hypothetical protein [Akkermansiaceae bacterium]